MHVVNVAEGDAMRRREGGKGGRRGGKTSGWVGL